MFVEKYKVNVNTRSEQQFTPLHFAVSNNRIDTVKYLLENNANINAVNTDGLTPMHIAIYKERLLIINYLLNNPNLDLSVIGTINGERCDCMQYASKSNNKELKKLFGITDSLFDLQDEIKSLKDELSKLKSDLRNDIKSDNATDIASLKSEIAILKSDNSKLNSELSKLKSDTDSEIASLKSEIANLKNEIVTLKSEIASLKNNSSQSQQIHTKQSQSQKYDRNKIFQYIKDGDLQAVRYCTGNGMLEAGLFKNNVPFGFAEINNESVKYDNVWLYFNSKPLIVASFFKRIDIVKLLIDSGAYINAKNNNGDTALMWASHHGNIETVKLLIDKGAKIDERNGYGNTALMWAMWNNQTNVVNYLNSHINQMHNQKYDKDKIFQYIKDGDLQAVKYCTSKGMLEAKLNGYNYPTGTNLIDKDGVRYNHSWLFLDATPIIVASFFGQVEIVKYLVENGANIHKKDCDGRNALMYASTNGNLEIVKYLLDKGININERNKTGITAFSRATWGVWNEIVQYLESKGGKV